jgi:hypothetical protein
VVGRHAGRHGGFVEHPRRAEMAAHIERGAQRIEGKKVAESVHDHPDETNKQIIAVFEH